MMKKWSIRWTKRFVAKKANSNKSNDAPLESFEQKQVVLKLDAIPYFKHRYHHSPNGEWRNKVTAVRLKGMGVKRGVSDLFFSIPKHGYHGLWVEMKRIKGSRLEDDQIDFINMQLSEGYAVFIASGCDKAMWAIKHYVYEKFDLEKWIDVQSDWLKKIRETHKVFN